jgi:hypothetical protein
VDGTNPTVGTHVLKSMIIGEPGAWIPFPSHSLLVYLGPKVEMLALDCRAERKLGRIVSKETYTKVFGEVRKLKGRGVEQLVILLGVPIGESGEGRKKGEGYEQGGFQGKGAQGIEAEARVKMKLKRTAAGGLDGKSLSENCHGSGEIV